VSYLDREIEIYRKVIDIINEKESKGKGLESVRKKLKKKIQKIEFLKSFN
jgi:hypothetical protein|tara:strand:+ start:47 stop:196 length:150 start_codon:yes stop_codon:yes gene_type:complete